MFGICRAICACCACFDKITTCFKVIFCCSGGYKNVADCWASTTKNLAACCKSADIAAHHPTIELDEVAVAGDAAAAHS